MKTAKQIADQQLLLSKYKDKHISSYRQVLRLINTGKLKGKKINLKSCGVSEQEIRNYNKKIEIIKNY